MDRGDLEYCLRSTTQTEGARTELVIACVLCPLRGNRNVPPAFEVGQQASENGLCFVFAADTEHFPARQ